MKQTAGVFFTQVTITFHPGDLSFKNRILAIQGEDKVDNMRSNFAEWAASFSGCDGGNPHAKIWLCGIEWGGANDEKYYKETLPAEIQKGCSQPRDSYDWKDSLTYPYGRSFAKLYASMQGKKVTTYREIEHLNGSEVFKLNLYPIAFQSTDEQLWRKQGLDKLTGFRDKNIYQTWCMLHRFQFFSDQVRVYAPEIIIGTGITYVPQFFLAFARQIGSQETINVGYLTAGKNNKNGPGRPFYWAKITARTTLCVIPFFSGANGLNSDDLLQEAGEMISRKTPSG